LHHIAELASVDQLALAGDYRRFDREQFTADFRPCESRDLSDLIILLGPPITITADAEVFREVMVRDADHALAWSEQQLLDDLAADVRELTFEVSDAGFARVVADDVEDCSIRD